MWKSVAITTAICVGSWGVAIYQARKVDRSVPASVVTFGEPIILSASGSGTLEQEVAHWSCPESFGEQAPQGIVVGCINGSAQYEAP